MYRTRRDRNIAPEAIELLKEELLAELDGYRDWREESRFGRFGTLYRGRGRQRDYREMNSLRNNIHREIRAMQAIENRVGRNRDPLVREILYDLMEEINNRGVTYNDLARSLPRKGMGERLKDLLPFNGGLNANSLILLLLLSFILLPSFRQSLRPVVKKILEGTMDISDKVNELFNTAKEEIEDIVAEANLSKLTEALNLNMNEETSGPGPDLNK